MESAPIPRTSPSSIDPGLERQYNLRLRHPERTAVYERFAKSSADFRAATPELRELRYGAGPRCVLDFFPARGGSAAPLFVFIHGGYWRALDHRIFSFLAKPWLARDVHVAMIGYDLAPSLSVRAIVAEVRAAMDFLRERAAIMSVDTRRIVIGGHSAGAQLGASALSADPGWHARGFLGVSGVYDLVPLLATSVNLDVRMSAADAIAASPIRQPAELRVRYLCAVGEAETDGFRAQTHAFAAEMQRQRCDALSVEVAGRNHFDLLDDLADDSHPLFLQASGLLGIPSR
ncbi:MAG: alpha/beta hydrolase [Betaproteobacteria bacterium]